ncbi:hypothetical protein N431DRAFT_443193 [Stipitochalara longipes BDJ]|nr:hypothetical protein N431DRAFT_443193 [Stipitochalara longipes BDJ]
MSITDRTAALMHSSSSHIDREEFGVNAKETVAGDGGSARSPAVRLNGCGAKVVWGFRASTPLSPKKKGFIDDQGRTDEAESADFSSPCAPCMEGSKGSRESEFSRFHKTDNATGL